MADTQMINSPDHSKTDDELRAAMDYWAQCVKDAGGWSSAYFAAKQCEGIERIAKQRGVVIENPHRIIRG